MCDHLSYNPCSTHCSFQGGSGSWVSNYQTQASSVWSYGIQWLWGLRIVATVLLVSLVTNLPPCTTNCTPGVLALVAESERHLEGPVVGTVAEAERTLIAKVPKPPRSPYFTNQDFHIDLETGHCTCLAGAVMTRLHSQSRDREGHGKQGPRQAFVFEGAVCDGCALRPQCVKAQPGRGRSVSLHP